MQLKEIIKALWSDIDNQDWAKLRNYFEEEASVNWPNTNESFSVDEFIDCNSKYPGDWKISVERLEQVENTVISVVKVQLKGSDASFHAVSFFEFSGNKILVLNEYWGDDGDIPKWRKDMKIGKAIK